LGSATEFQIMASETGDDINVSTEEHHAEMEDVDRKKEDETDAEIEAMKKKLKEMEQVAGALGKPQEGDKDSAEVDNRSVYVGNVDYSTIPEELQEFFKSCGVVNRITILCDKFTGHPKGFAYVEFADAEAVVNAIILNETEFKGRQIKISPKRTNIPGYNRARGRGRGSRGRGRGGPPRGGAYGTAPPFYGGGYAGAGYGGGYDGGFRGRGGYGPVRGRRGWGFHPYY